jgi:hypothetical protein
LHRTIAYNLLLLILAISVSHASTYLNEEAAQEGLKRGQSEHFASSTGHIGIYSAEGASRESNGVLISPSLVITTRHALENLQPGMNGRFCTYHNVQEYTVAFLDKHIPPHTRDYFWNFGCPLDLSNIFFHPDETVDLAIVRLQRNLKVKPLPLLLDQPKKWSTGFLVSYAPTYTSPASTEVFARDRRHISIFDVQESTVELKTQKGIETMPALLKYWDLEGNIEDPLNRRFVPKDDMHRLTAFTQISDSGAGFVAKCENGYQVAGVHLGRFVLYDELDMQTKISTNIIPFYPYKSWIKKIMKKAP